jgi:hypothetical protein
VVKSLWGTNNRKPQKTQRLHSEAAPDANVLLGRNANVLLGRNANVLLGR